MQSSRLVSPAPAGRSRDLHNEVDGLCHQDKKGQHQLKELIEAPSVLGGSHLTAAGQEDW